MSDLNCELMGKFKVFLLGVPLALGVLAGCSEEVEYEMPIYDFVNPSVCFFVSDAATAENATKWRRTPLRPRRRGPRCRGRWRCGSKG